LHDVMNLVGALQECSSRAALACGLVEQQCDFRAKNGLDFRSNSNEQLFCMLFTTVHTDSN